MEEFKIILEGLDSALANYIDVLEDVAQTDTPEADEAQDYIDELEAIRGIIND